jgi:hypothetical protein
MIAHLQCHLSYFLKILFHDSPDAWLKQHKKDSSVMYTIGSPDSPMCVAVDCSYEYEYLHEYEIP